MIDQRVSVARPSELQALRAPGPRDGVALSGGGAKGSWQVGALKYLMRLQGVTPDVITCTSVGAVNGLKLAEGEGPAPQGATQARGLDGLEQIWLSLSQPSDMFVPSPTFAKLGADAYNAPGMIADQLLEKAGSSLTGVAVQGASYVLLLGIPGAWFTDTTPISGLINTVIELADQADSFYTLDPIAARLDNGDLNVQLVNHSDISLAMSMVSLTSGALRYVRFAGVHNGRLVGYLVERDQLTAPLAPVTSIGDGIDMRTAMLASAAAPIFFAPQSIKSNGPLPELYTDGGVRELVPVQAAIDLGADRVFALDCNAPFGSGATVWPHDGPGTPSGILPIALTVLSELLDEIDLGDTVPPPDDGPRFWHVRPRFEAEGDMEIDQAAIRINIDDGYMCAFDGVDGVVRSAPRRDLLQQLGTRIAVSRRDIADCERCLQWVVQAWSLVESGTSSKDDMVDKLNYHRYPGDSDKDTRIANLTNDLDVGMHWNPQVKEARYIDGMLAPPWQRLAVVQLSDALQTLRTMKADLQPLYEARRTIGGARAVPPDANDATAPDQPWLRWEYPQSSQAFYGDLWPDGFPGGGTLDEQTANQVTARQVESRGTSGWAIRAAVTNADSMPIGVQLLAASGHELEHLTGEYLPSSGSAWQPAGGSKWHTTWATVPSTPVDLGAPVGSAVMCWLTGQDSTDVQAIVRITGSGDAGDTLTELAFDPRTGWTVLGPVTIAEVPLTGVIGDPVLIEARFAQEEGFELLVPLQDRVAHLHRRGTSGDWAPRGTGVMYTAPTPTDQGASATTSAQVGVAVACIQANYGLPSNLEAVVAVAPQPGQPANALVALWYDAYARAWQSSEAIQVGGVDLSAISGDPVMLQSSYGRQGDFELLVPAGSKVYHLFRDNDNGMVWKARGGGVMYDADTGGGGSGGGPTALHRVGLSPQPISVACWQSISGTPEQTDLHAVLRATSPAAPTSGNVFLTRRFDSSSQSWSAVDDITVNGQSFTA